MLGCGWFYGCGGVYAHGGAVVFGVRLPGCLAVDVCIGCFVLCVVVLAARCAVLVRDPWCCVVTCVAVLVVTGACALLCDKIVDLGVLWPCTHVFPFLSVCCDL